MNLGLVKGPDGIQGPPGQDGAAGEPGKAATIKIGSVSSGDAPMVSNSGSETEAVFDFTLPVGPEGPAGPQGEPGKDGQQLWAAYVDENGHLIVQYEGTEAPPLRLDENGHLLYDANGQSVDLGVVKGSDGAPGKDGAGVPVPVPGDVGKIPVVNSFGDGYELVSIGEIEWNLISSITFEEDTTVVIAHNVNYTEFLVHIKNESGQDSSMWKRLFLSNKDDGGPETTNNVYSTYYTYPKNKNIWIYAHPLGDSFYQSLLGNIDGNAYPNGPIQQTAKEQVKNFPYIKFYNQGAFHTGDIFELWGR